MVYYLSAFILSLIGVYTIKNYLIAFAVSAVVYIIAFFIMLSANAQEGSTFNSRGIPNTIAEALGIFLIPFLVARMIHGFTTKKEKKDEKVVPNADEINTN